MSKLFVSILNLTAVMDQQLLDIDAEPVDFFDLLFPEQLWTLIAQETNKINIDFREEFHSGIRTQTLRKFKHLLASCLIWDYTKCQK